MPDFDAVGMGFLWPEEVEITNAYDQTMTIRPSGWHAGFDEADENGRMSLRLYETQLGTMTENQVAAWVCGGNVAWIDILKAIHRIVGDNKPMRVSSLRQQMSLLGVSDTAFELTLFRLLRGGYAQIDGEGDAKTITIVRW